MDETGSAEALLETSTDGTEWLLAILFVLPLWLLGTDCRNSSVDLLSFVGAVLASLSSDRRLRIRRFDSVSVVVSCACGFCVLDAKSNSIVRG